MQQKICTLLSHIRAQTELGQQILITLNWCQITLGSSTPLFLNSTTPKYIEKNWFTHIQDFLISINGKIDIFHAWHPKPMRDQDVLIMDVLQQEDLTIYQQKVINNWRIFFKVLTLSDISTCDGILLRPRYTNYPTDNNWEDERKSSLDWPIQQKPDQRSFKIWKQWLLNTFAKTGSLILKQKLGSWTTPPSTAISTWTYYYDHSSSKLYKLESNAKYAIEMRYSFRDRSSIHYHTPAQPTPVIPINELNQCIPVDTHDSITISIKTRYISDTRITNCNHTTMTEAIPNNFTMFLSQQDRWIRTIFDSWIIEDHDKLTKYLTSDSRLLIASDGGYVDGRGSFGVVIGTDSEDLCSISGNAPGNSESHSSYRSESYGILGALIFLRLWVSFHNISFCDLKQWELYCDNEGLVSQLNKFQAEPMSPIDYISTDSDVAMQILDTIGLLNKHVLIHIRHIKGHQDQHTPFERLTRPAQLNVLADKAAGNQLAKQLQISYEKLPASQVSWFINNNVITNRHKDSIRKASLSPDLRIYMVQKFKWNSNIPDRIWWHPIGSAIRTLSMVNRTRIQKWKFYHLPTNKRQALFHNSTASLCQLCNNVEECDDHIIQCTHTSCSKIRSEWLEEIYNYCNTITTICPEITRCILRGMKDWLQQQKITPISHLSYIASDGLIRAYEEQSHIGWNHFMRGRLSIQWRSLIQHSLDNNRKNNLISGKKKQTTPESWASNLIQINWKYFVLLWENRIDITNTTSTENQLTTSIQHLHDEAIWLLHNKPNLHDIDKQWISKTPADIQKLSKIQLITWIQQYKDLVRMTSKHGEDGNFAL